MEDDSTPLEIQLQKQAGRVAYLEGEVAELEARMAALKRELVVTTWELAEAIIQQAALEREKPFFSMSR